MRSTVLLLLVFFTFLTSCQQGTKNNTKMAEDETRYILDDEKIIDHKIIVYQLMVRLFGNKKSVNKTWGTLEENGCGQFGDVSDTALIAIKNMGITHIWYTGAIEHATLTDFSKQGIPADDPDVVKGQAGSPYAIRDYYDAHPALAKNVRKRSQELEELIARTHRNGLKVIIDFVPNHLARAYKSDRLPIGSKDFGAKDDTTKAFLPSNNFYYLPGKAFQAPKAWRTPDMQNQKHDGRFMEMPSKATGNNVFKENPSADDWYETVKLNYGVDFLNGEQKYFDPIPDTWVKMRDILTYWADKKVDGFRCDMAEMVPIEFWAWVIPQIRQLNPRMIFIAEIYNPSRYKEFIEKGNFNYLYDKVGLYDTLKSVIQSNAPASHISICWQNLRGINSYMLRFLENHDEQRIASPQFAGDFRKGLPMMLVAATLNSGPIMLYAGQEVGEAGAGNEGFNGDDGRTSIFDYWGMPEHQKWMNGGKFDGEGLSQDQRRLRSSYSRLLNLCRRSEAIRKGRLIDLQSINENNPDYDARKIYSYIRYSANQKLIMVSNFDIKPHDIVLTIPSGLWSETNLLENNTYVAYNLLGDEEISFKPRNGIKMTLAPLGIYVLELRQN
jgi:glycosidase